MTEQILVFLRRPELGKVKSRLAKAIGNEKALDIYNWLVEITRNEVEKTDVKINLYFDNSNGFLPDWVKTYTTYFQKGNNLGERMALAFKDRFNIEPKSKLVLIGSDCPDISVEILNTAIESLEENTVVLGPASDGGVYLIGLNEWNEGLFDSVLWSTDSVFKSLVKNCIDLKLSYKILDELNDIDVVDDFLPYKEVYNKYKNTMHVAG